MRNTCVGCEWLRKVSPSTMGETREKRQIWQRLSAMSPKNSVAVPNGKNQAVMFVKLPKYLNFTNTITAQVIKLRILSLEGIGSSPSLLTRSLFFRWNRVLLNSRRR